MTWVLILIVMLLIGILIAYLAAYKFQVKKISEELDFIKNSNTNLTLSTDIPGMQVSRLISAFNEVLEVKNEREIEAEHYKERLSSALTNLSHDIRTPLTSIQGYTELLLESEPSDEQIEYLNIICSKSKELKIILDNIFELIKSQDINNKPEMEPVNIRDLLFKEVCDFYTMLEDRNFAVNIQIPDYPIYIMANEQAIRRVFNNLIENAIIHGRDNLEITLDKKRHTENTIEISVSNTFDGKEKISIESVFDRFYKGDSKRTPESTGLGLPIAKSLVEKMGGSIESKINDDRFEMKLNFESIEF